MTVPAARPCAPDVWGAPPAPAGPSQYLFDVDDPYADLEVVDLESLGGAAPGRSIGRSRSTPAPDDRGPSRATPMAVAAALVLVVAGVWGYLSFREVTSIRTDLVDARAHLQQAVDAVGEGSFATAGPYLEDADATFGAVPSRIDGALLAPARLVPAGRRNLDAVRDLSAAAAAITGPGIDLIEVLAADGDGLGALSPRDGRIPLDVFDALVPVLADAVSGVAEAQQLVAQVPTAGIDAAVVAARDEFLTIIEPLAAQLADARDVIDAVPTVLGGDGSRRYIVVASNPAEARGTGGFFGAFTILEAVDGVLSFSPVIPTQDLPEVPRGEIPWPDPSLEDRYDAYGGTGFIVNLNMTPDFPAAATAIANFYAESAGEAVDGVIAVDPFAFEALLRLSGPVTLPGYGTVDADEVVEFVSRDAYSTIVDPEERKRLIGVVAAAALQGFLDSPDAVSARAVLSTLGEMAARGSILIHLAAPELQGAIDGVGASGRFGVDEWGDLLAITLNSGSPSKVDYWLQRVLRYDVSLATDGVVAGIVSAGFANDAPRTGEPIYMIGADNDLIDAGDALHYVSAYCAIGCRFQQVPSDGFQGLQSDVGVELDHPVASTWMRVPSGRSSELIWSHLTPDGWRNEGGDIRYRLTYQHQTTLRPTRLEIVVGVPDGHEATGVPDGAVVVGDEVQVDVDATRDLVLDFVFSPSG
jgi:hypothetical protein